MCVSCLSLSADDVKFSERVVTLPGLGNIQGQHWDWWQWWYGLWKKGGLSSKSKYPSKKCHITDLAVMGKYVYAVRVGNREWQALLAAAPGPGLHASQRVRLARPARTVMLMPVKGGEIKTLFGSDHNLLWCVFSGQSQRGRPGSNGNSSILYYSAKCCLYCECDGDKREVAGHRLVCR